MKKKDIVIAAVAILVVAGLAYGLSRRSLGLPLTPSSPFKTGSDVAKKPEAKGNVIMTVNGETITEGEFNTLAQGAPAESRAFYATPAGRRAMADELAKLKALEQEGERMKIADDPEVQTQLKAMRGQVIAARTLEKLIEKRAEPLILKAFNDQKGKSKSLRHIALAYNGGQIPPRDPNANLTADQAMAKARDLVKQLRGGLDFGATAAAVSDDMQSGQKGGLLGPFQPEMLPPEIGGAVKDLKLGQISDPVKTQYGIHIFRIEEPTLEDLRPMLAQQVKQQVAQEELARVQKASKIDLDPKFFPPAPLTPPPGQQQKPQ